MVGDLVWWFGDLNRSLVLVEGNEETALAHQTTGIQTTRIQATTTREADSQKCSILLRRVQMCPSQTLVKASPDKSSGSTRRSELCRRRRKRRDKVPAALGTDAQIRIGGLIKKARDEHGMTIGWKTAQKTPAVVWGPGI